MADYEIGRGKPPKHTRFPLGKSGNPNGRPKRTADPLAEVIQGILDAPAQYRENGRTKTTSRDEVRLKMLLKRAVEGDIKAADELFEERRYALKRSGSRAPRVIVTDWLEDFDGQTAEDKSRAKGAPTPGPRKHPDDRAKDQVDHPEPGEKGP